MDSTDIFNRIKGDKSRVCKLGETAVIMKMTEMGWDAFNLNSTNPNYKGVDVLAVNPQNLESLFIQVKSSAENSPNFPTGFVSDRKGNIEGEWKKKIIGPWAFVHIGLKEEKINYTFYILTQEEVIKLIEDSNKWYWSQPERNAKRDKQPIGLPVSWITGNGLKNYGHTYRSYPREVEIADPYNDAGWAKIGMPKSGIESHT